MLRCPLIRIIPPPPSPTVLAPPFSTLFPRPSIKMTDKPIRSTCHCGAITVIAPRLPDMINECQCTICRRYAAAWAYYQVDEVQFEIRDGVKLSKYVWGDKQKSFNFCENCGCVCFHWPFAEKRPDGSPARFGLNTRNMDPMELLFVTRRIDKSWLFKPIDDKTMAHEQDQAKY